MISDKSPEDKVIVPESPSNEPSHPASDGPLLDDFDRPMKSLRLSVTDRCNLACTYCMPDGGPDHFAPREEILSYEEMATLTEIFVDMGVDNVRITGGEPLLRKQLYRLVEMLVEIEGLEEVTLTTNGFLLADRIERLASAGLDRINFSLDTFVPEKFEEISQKTGFQRVMEGLRALLDTPSLHPVKINAVAVKGFNDDELVDFADWAVETGQNVRFIEFMPLERGRNWSQEKLLLAPEMKSIIRRQHTLEPKNGSEHAPATSYYVSGTEATVGFITSVSDPFCGSCDRIRLTAEGQIKNCLFSYDEDDVRSALRNGAGVGAIKRIIVENYRDKWEGGCVKLKKGEYDPAKQSRTMSRIGG